MYVYSVTYLGVFRLVWIYTSELFHICLVQQFLWRKTDGMSSQRHVIKPDSIRYKPDDNNVIVIIYGRIISNEQFRIKHTH